MTDATPERVLGSRYYKRVWMRGACLVTFILSTAQAPAPQNGPAPGGPQKIWTDSKMDASGLIHISVGASAIFVSNDVSGITARAKPDGSVLWKADLPSAAPAAAAGDVVAILSATAIDVLDQRTGSARWRVDLPKEFQRPRFWSVPLAERRALYATRDRLVLVVGKQLQTWRHGGSIDWGAVLVGQVTTALVDQGETLLLGTNESSLVALDAKTGSIRWQTRLATAPAFLTVAKDRVYVTGAAGGLYCFRQAAASPGRPFRVVGSAGPPAVDGERVYVTLLDNTLRQFDGGCGTQRWTRPLPTRPESGPIVHGTRLTAILISGLTFTVSKNSGDPEKTTEPPADGNRLQAMATDADASVVYTITASEQAERVLTAWRLVSQPPG